MRKVAFLPLVDSGCRVLLLGTMPGEESLRKRQYYGNKQNHFWKIICSLFGEPVPDGYGERVKILLSNHIALWDVLQSCEGQGSLDSNIKNEQPNDFRCFYNKYPSIRTVVFTSRKAEAYYRKYVGFDGDRLFMTLPSPSPANARMGLDAKVRHWQVLHEALADS